MPAVALLRHAQASFGAADYDVLSPLGHEQARAAGRALAAQGMRPVRLFTGSQRRHRETLEGVGEGLGLDAGRAEVHPGLDEFDFRGLLDARFREGGAPEGMHEDRRAHLRALQDTLLAWQRDEIDRPPERFADFAARVRDARDAMVDAAAGSGADVLAVSSGGPIGETVRSVLDAPAGQMIALQLQLRNCGLSRLAVARTGLFLSGFNETPHIDAANEARLLTYS